MLSLEDMALRQEAKKKNENKGISFQGNDGAASAGEYNPPSKKKWLQRRLDVA